MPFFSRLAKFLSRNIFAVIGVLLMISSITVIVVSLITSGALDGVPVAQHEKSINQIFAGLIFVGFFLILLQSCLVPSSARKNKEVQGSQNSADPIIKSKNPQIKTSMTCPACGNHISFWKIAFGGNNRGQTCRACKASLTVASSRTRRVVRLFVIAGVLVFAPYLLLRIGLQKEMALVLWFLLFLLLVMFDALYTCNRDTLVRCLYIYGSPKSVKTGAFPAATLSVKPQVMKFINKGRLQSPSDGKVLSINVKVGDKANSDDVVLVIEKMSVKIEVVSPRNGIVKKIYVSEGQTVRVTDPLMVIKG